MWEEGCIDIFLYSYLFTASILRASEKYIGTQMHTPVLPIPQNTGKSCHFLFEYFSWFHI